MSRLSLILLKFNTWKLFAKGLILVFVSINACAVVVADSLESAQQACERFEVNSPVKGSQTPELKPHISWSGDALLSYRLQLAVVLPEGRILDSVDLHLVGNHWVFTSPVSVPLAAVKVIVSRHCPALSIQDLQAQPPQFFINDLQSCVVEPLSVSQNKSSLQWRSSSKVDRFTVTLFMIHTDQSGLLTISRDARYEVQKSQWDFPVHVRNQLLLLTSNGASLVASVQAQCGAVWSQPQSLSLRSAA